ncbi:Protein of unknown function [Cotesia congregata]|uniref:Uncharacterized protein n=1 Tax=Cotesia congregata TaxID=51543 RepID=A0A8J2H3E0_COTCN|nr:Protein of unknown function [Cotesia congregata]
MKMKLIIVLCAVSMAASWPVYEDPYQNWGIYIPPEPEYYDDDLNSDYNRPIDFNPITHKPGIRKSTTSTTTFSTVREIGFRSIEHTKKA